MAQQQEEEGRDPRMDFLISENSPWSHRIPICFLKTSQQESSSQHMSLGGQGTSKEPCGWSYAVLVSAASMVGGWAVGAQRSLSIIYPTVHQADPRASTLANPYGPCFQFIHLLPQTWPRTKPLLTASTPPPPTPPLPPCPWNSHPVCVSASLLVFPTSGHPQLDGVAPAKAVFHRLLPPSSPRSILHTLARANLTNLIPCLQSPRLLLGHPNLSSLTPALPSPLPPGRRVPSARCPCKSLLFPSLFFLLWLLCFHLRPLWA